MKAIIKYLFTMLEEKPGVISSSRVMFMLGTIFAMVMTAWVFAVSKDWTAVIAVFPSLYSPAAIQKSYQKSQEIKTA